MREWIAPTRCVGCGAEHRGRLCTACVPHTIHRTPPPTEAVAGSWTLASYETPVGKAVVAAKYGADRQLTRILGRYLGERLVPAVAPGQFAAVVPAPSPWTRRLRRGFSPASVVAAEVARALGLPLLEALRLAPGTYQASLNRSARVRSLAGRLRARRDVPGRVLLVDDVVTTGSTAEACARELLGGQTSELWLATLCQQRVHDVR